MKNILGLILILASIGNAYANQDDVANGTKEEELSRAYITCAYFGDFTNPVYGNTAVVPDADIAKFRMAALKHYKTSLPYFNQNYTADELIINYAEFVSSNEAVLGERAGMEGREVAQTARMYYHQGNCELLLETIK